MTRVLKVSLKIAYCLCFGIFKVIIPACPADFFCAAFSEARNV